MAVVAVLGVLVAWLYVCQSNNAKKAAEKAEKAAYMASGGGEGGGQMSINMNPLRGAGV